MKTLVSVGFERRSFNRLLRCVDQAVEMNILDVDVLFQVGHSQYIPKFGEHKRFLDPVEMKKAIEERDIIITHGGVGTVVTCLNLNKVPIIFPRKKRFGEHVDDHQVDFARAMDRHHRVITVYTQEELFSVLHNYESLMIKCVTKPIFDGKETLQNHLKTSLAGIAARLKYTR